MDDERRPDETVVAPSTAEHVLIWIGFPLAGAAAGWLLRAIAAWVTTVSWVPLPGPIRFAVEMVAGAPYAAPIALGIGAAAGLVVAMLSHAEQVTVTVRDDHLHLRHGETEQRVEHSAIAAVFLDGKHLVAHGARGEELLREASDLDQHELEAALRAHAYPWFEDDPRAQDLRRWVPGLDGLPAGADPLLKARQRALEKDDADDAAQLRDELATLGVVVRDDASRQHWRRVDPKPDPDPTS